MGRATSKKIKHYLITIDLGDCHLHGYVMTDDKDAVIGVADEMMKIAEKPGIRFLPIILQTELDTGADIVRNILRKEVKVRKVMDEATDFHRCIFAMTKDNPDDETLMELH